MKIISIDESNCLKEATNCLKRCGIIVFPTETVYGVGTLVECEKSVERIYLLKKRNREKPMLLHISSKEDVFKYAIKLNKSALKLIENLWPGSISLVLHASHSAPKYIVAKNGTIGLRMPKDDFFLRLSKEVGPLVATSANISNELPPLTVKNALSQLKGGIDLYIDGGKAKKGKASTVIDMTKTPPLILREGAISAEEIEKIIGEKVKLLSGS